MDRRIDPQGVGDLQLLAPVDLLHRSVQALGALHPEAAEWLKDADRRPALEDGPIERFLLLSRRRREFDCPPADPQVGGADRFELPGKDPFEPLECPRRHPRRLVGNRRRERTGNGMDGGERRRHGGHEGEGGDGRKRTILPSGRHKNGPDCPWRSREWQRTPRRNADCQGSPSICTLAYRIHPGVPRGTMRPSIAEPHPMKTVSFTEFRANAASYLDDVERGQTVILLRHGKPIAEIHPVTAAAGRAPSWQRAGPRLVVKGTGLAAAILGERGREDVF